MPFDYTFNTMSADLAKIGLEWGYQGDYAPEFWSNKYPLASGSHQSPIDINTQQAIYDSRLNQHVLEFAFSAKCFTKVLNTGSSFKVTGENEASSKITGGPLNDNVYKFAQFHMHWGNDDSTGSEHLVDGHSYAAELHFVTWNSSLYENVNQAAGSNKHDGLGVLGVFVKVGKNNHEFAKLLDSVSHIPLRDQSVDLSEPLDLKNLFPNDTKSYWTYLGSLTTPPCTESVKWIVFKEPIEISREQLERFRHMYQCKNSSECCETFKISKNYRPVCNLNDRKLFKSFN